MGRTIWLLLFSLVSVTAQDESTSTPAPAEPKPQPAAPAPSSVKDDPYAGEWSPNPPKLPPNEKFNPTTRWKKAQSPSGWLELGRYCMGYLPTGRTEPDSPETLEGAIGRVDLVLWTEETDPANQPKKMAVYFYDDQKQSWPAIDPVTKVPDCKSRYAFARNYGRAPVVEFDENGFWKMPQQPLSGHIRPREWYVVLANCDGISEIKYDLTFYSEGWYNFGQGPLQCEPVTSVVEVQKAPAEEGVGVLVTLLIITIIILFCCLHHYRKQAMGGGFIPGRTDTFGSGVQMGPKHGHERVHDDEEETH